MHVGVDATCWQNTRGYGRHARALLGALVRIDTANSYTFFVDSPAALASLPARAEPRLVAARQPAAEAASASGRRSIADTWRMSRALSDSRLDVLFFPTVYTYVPVLSRARKLVMLHDVIAETFPELTLPSWSARLAWNAKVALGRWQADAVATVSDYSRQAIIERFHMEPRRVHVIGEAPDPIFRVLSDAQPSPRLAELGLADGRLVTYVGGFAPHKNLPALISAFAQLVRSGNYPDLHLVMVGEYRSEVFHSHFAELEATVRRLALAERTIFTGYLSDEDLVVLLNRSTVLALPSLMEGYGLPAVEAAACGCPVVATTASPLPGLLGAGGLYVDPHQPDQLERALASVLDSESLRREMRAAGLSAVQRLTWEHAAGTLAHLLNEVAAA